MIVTGNKWTRRSAERIALVLFGIGCGDIKTENAVVATNSDPVADAGSDVSQTADEEVPLDGSRSYDPDGDTIKHHWSFDTVPAGSGLAAMESPFADNHTTTPTSSFRPDVEGTYIVALTVTDESGATSAADTLLVVIVGGELPVADAGGDQEGMEGSTFTLDGSGSYDATGRDLTFEWSFASIPASSTLTSLVDETTDTPSFVADVGGIYVAALVVHNGIIDSEPDTVIVDVEAASPVAPVADAGEDVTDTEDCTSVALDGTGSSDANGDSLEYRWAMQIAPSGSTATDDNIADTAAAETTFWPDVAGDYTLSLAVYDGADWSAPDMLNITASERASNSAPTVDAGGPTAVDGGDAECTESGYTYECEDCSEVFATIGSDATIVDDDGDPLVYEWTVVDGYATITDSTLLEAEVEFEGAAPLEPGQCEDTEYTFELVVTDCPGASSGDVLVVNVACCGSTGSADSGSKAPPSAGSEGNSDDGKNAPSKHRPKNDRLEMLPSQPLTK